ncbi:hypothetical protein W97_09122 [Coniosporium apollinis CBS 100218]|uniref:ER lumen protein retaining receptor n=1 Tax=Coniosporium apollinis (strain CBS 100218) TaxID=1168221 RepID=R7Z766_CONA1|nr:uncharacterized protein W97_09122 [Coniosporium apollinis CBS 100218]EON69859.1 hypothetical protein W97_09122 [Coniosporium apollinis CBS 100218]
MAFNFNIFRILGDLSHAISIVVLIWAIHSNRSAEGVSLITQVLYIAVFCARYIDIFWVPAFSEWHHTWNFFGKLFYTLTGCYIVFLMTRVYARTREREKAWKLGVWSTIGSVIGAPVVYLIFIRFAPNRPAWEEILWTFSIILESFAILPQLLLLRQTTVPTVIDSFYLATLGAYRAFYILNWFVRWLGPEHHFDPTSMVFGVLQTAFYVDFAWVYWSRQRVKLRHGALVDSGDLEQGWLVKRFVGRGGAGGEEGDAAYEAATANERPRARTGGRWGPRGISVSADEDLVPSAKRNGSRLDGVAEEERLADPGLFEDEESDDEQSRAKGPSNAVEGVGNGAEWRDDRRK